MTKSPVAVNPKNWPRPSGYANAVVAEGKIVAIAGQIGWDPVRHTVVSEEFVPQVRQALANVLTVLEAAGGEVHDLVQLTWYITDSDAYRQNLKQIGKVYREEMGRHYPAMSVVIVTGLVESGAKVEIEGTAVIANGAQNHLR